MHDSKALMVDWVMDLFLVGGIVAPEEIIEVHGRMLARVRNPAGFYDKLLSLSTDM
jgi:hypothetical protein